jgi:hypothetical protein
MTDNLPLLMTWGDVEGGTSFNRQTLRGLCKQGLLPSSVLIGTGTQCISGQSDSGCFHHTGHSDSSRIISSATYSLNSSLKEIGLEAHQLLHPG